MHYGDQNMLGWKGHEEENMKTQQVVNVGSSTVHELLFFLSTTEVKMLLF